MTNVIANMMGGMFPGMNMLNKSSTINPALLGGGNKMPDISQLLATMNSKSASALPGNVPEFMNHRRATQKTAFSAQPFGSPNSMTASPSNSADLVSSSAWVYLILWYLIQQFVTNNTATATLMRPPGSVAVADHLRNLFWWIVVVGAIAWLVLAIVVGYLQVNVDDLSMASGVIGRLFSG